MSRGVPGSGRCGERAWGRTNGFCTGASPESVANQLRSPPLFLRPEAGLSGVDLLSARSSFSGISGLLGLWLARAGGDPV